MTARIASRRPAPALVSLVSTALVALWLGLPQSGCGPSSTTGAGFQDRPDLAFPLVTDVDKDGYPALDPVTRMVVDCDDHDPLTHPGAQEICFDHKDQNCDGIVDEICDDDKDGYNICPGGDTHCLAGEVAPNGLPGGDCADDDRVDGDQYINPGAYDYKNGIDDDCNGVVDDVPPSCDVGLVGMTDPLSFARSFGACPPWLTNAVFNLRGSPQGRRIDDHFGLSFKPQDGGSMGYFSTGIAADEKETGFQPVQKGTAFGTQEDNPGPVTSTNICTGVKQGAPTKLGANDMQEVIMTIRVPTNAKGFQFSENFFSSEYPEYVGNQYNDMFVAWVESKGYTGNISWDPNKNPISVNSSFFQVCDPSPICMNGGHNCSKSSALLNGTGYEQLDNTGLRFGGATDWLTTSQPVTPGETITLSLFIYDGGDAWYDSAILFDDFHWVFQETTNQTVPLQ